MKNKWLRLGAIFIGIVMVLLGLLWLLQGVGVIQMCPVLCFANCECITGGSLTWAIIGAVVFIIGLTVVYKSFRSKKPSLPSSYLTKYK